VIVGGIRDNIGHLVNVVCPHPVRGAWWVVEVLGTCLGYTLGEPHELRVMVAGEQGSIRDVNLWPLRDKKEPACANVTSAKR
jgi:hypothetical protein